MKSDMSKTAVHLVILYVLVVILTIVVVVAGTTSDEGGEWACAQQVCVADEPAGEQWAAENCGEVTQDNGIVVEACRVVIDGSEQIIRRDAINLSAIRNCVEFACVQEVRVRNLEQPEQ